MKKSKEMVKTKRNGENQNFFLEKSRAKFGSTTKILHLLACFPQNQIFWNQPKNKCHYIQNLVHPKCRGGIQH